MLYLKEKGKCLRQVIEGLTHPEENKRMKLGEAVSILSQLLGRNMLQEQIELEDAEPSSQRTLRI